MIKITNQQVNELLQGIYFFNQTPEPKPFKLGYTISKHDKKLREHYLDFDGARIKLCEEYALKTADGSPRKETKMVDGKEVEGEFLIDPEKKKEFDAKIADLLKSEVEMPDYKAKLDDIPKDYKMPTFPFQNTFFEYFITE